MKIYTTHRVFDGEKHVTISGTLSASESGWASEPEYRICYQLADGSGFLSVTRHLDRGDLATDFKKTKRLPAWATRRKYV